MKLNLEECCIIVSSEEKKNKHNNWVVKIHCGSPKGKSIESFKHGCDMVYQLGFSSRTDAENVALRKFIQDRFHD